MLWFSKKRKIKAKSSYKWDAYRPFSVAPLLSVVLLTLGVGIIYVGHLRTNSLLDQEKLEADLFLASTFSNVSSDFSSLDSLLLKASRNKELARNLDLRDEAYVKNWAIAFSNLVQSKVSSEFASRVEVYDFNFDLFFGTDIESQASNFSKLKASLEADEVLSWATRKGSFLLMEQLVYLGQKPNPSGVLLVTWNVQPFSNFQSDFIDQYVVFDGKVLGDKLQMQGEDLRGRIATIASLKRSDMIQSLDGSKTLYGKSTGSFLGSAFFGQNFNFSDFFVLQVVDRPLGFSYIPYEVMGVAAFLALLSLFLFGYIQKKRKGLVESLMLIHEEVGGFDPRRAMKESAPEHQLQALHQAVIKKLRLLTVDFQGKNVEISKHKNILRRVRDLAAVDDRGFANFAARFHSYMRQSEDQLVLLRYTKGGNWASALEKISQLVYSIICEAQFYHMEQMFNKANTFEAYLTKILAKGESVHLAQDLVEVEERLQGLKEELDAYTQTRAKVLGREEAGSRNYTISASQYSWMNSLVGRILTALKVPSFHTKSVPALVDELKEAISSIGKVDIREYISKYESLANQVSKDASNRIGPLKLEGNHFWFEPKLFPYVNECIMHCIRNAAAHGIESSIVRKAKGKPDLGTLSIQSDYFNGSNVIVFNDDGGGINQKALWEKAGKQGLEVPEGDKSFDDLKKLLFARGLTSHEQATGMGGYGLGMFAVAEVLEQIGGEADLTTSEGHGTSIKLVVPDYRAPHIQAACYFNPHRYLLEIVEQVSMYNRMKSRLSWPNEVAKTFAVANLNGLADSFWSLVSISLGSLYDDIELRVESRNEVLPEGEHILHVDFSFEGRLSPDLFSKWLATEQFQNAAQRIIAEPGCSFSPLMDRVGYTMSFGQIIPAVSAETKICITLLGRRAEATQAIFQDYLDRMLAGWPIEFYVDNFEALKEKEAIQLAVVDYEYIEKKASSLAIFVSEKWNYLIVDDWMKDMQRSNVFSYIPDAYFVKGKVDTTAVQMLIEVGIRRLLQEQSPKKETLVERYLASA